MHTLGCLTYVRNHLKISRSLDLYFPWPCFAVMLWSLKWLLLILTHFHWFILDIKASGFHWYFYTDEIFCVVHTFSIEFQLSMRSSSSLFRLVLSFEKLFFFSWRLEGRSAGLLLLLFSKCSVIQYIKYFKESSFCPNTPAVYHSICVDLAMDDQITCDVI